MTIQYNSYLRSEEYLYRYTGQLSSAFLAVLEEDIEELDKIKFSTEFSLNSADLNGNTLLHVAVIKNKLKSLEYLLTQDAVSIDAKNMIGQTPIFNACRMDKVEITKKLIEAGASINIQDSQKNTPLHISVCNPEITHILIKHGADIEVFNFYEDTPLHNAVTVENLETVCLLLYYNSDATVKNSEGNTPFMDALIYENYDIQKALINYVDDFNVSTSDGDTILTLALTYQSCYVEEIILRGANVNRRALESSLMIDNYKVFESIWKRLPSVELENSNLLDKFAYGIRRNNILKYFDIILENSEDASLHALATVFNSQVSFADLIEICAHKHGLAELTRLTCCLLQYNCRFLIPTVFQIYYYFGYCDLFKYFLHQDHNVEKYELESSFAWIIPKYIFYVNYDMKMICEELSNEPGSDGIHQKAALRSLEYSVDFCLVQLLNKHFYDNEEFMSIRERIPTVPSLLQLARDKIRKYIVETFNFQKPSQFYTFLNSIDIAKVYKQIITLEKKIYSFNLR